MNSVPTRQKDAAVRRLIHYCHSWQTRIKVLRSVSGVSIGIPSLPPHFPTNYSGCTLTLRGRAIYTRSSSELRWEESSTSSNNLGRLLSFPCSKHPYWVELVANWTRHSRSPLPGLAERLPDTSCDTQLGLSQAKRMKSGDYSRWGSEPSVPFRPKTYCWSGRFIRIRGVPTLPQILEPLSSWHDSEKCPSLGLLINSESSHQSGPSVSTT